MNILATTDGSPHSLQVLGHVAALQSATGGHVTLTRILNPLTDLGGVYAPSVQAATEQVRATWLPGLEAVLADAGLSDASANVTVLVHKERAQHGIARAAQEVGAELIAMDSRGAGAIKHALVGSVAMSTIGEFEGPVLLSGPKAGPPKPRTAPYHILMTDDGSPAAKAIFEAMAPLLEGTETQVTLIHIYSPVATDRGEQVERKDAMERLKDYRKLLPSSIRVEVGVRVISVAGGVDTAILAAADEFGADAIAMATHGHSARYHLFAGSTAMSIVGKSPVPVILRRP